MDVCGWSNVERVNDDFSININRPDYSTYDGRLLSFRNWPSYLPLKPDDLAEAGLYYTGRGDAVICFKCREGLKQWEPSDDPWIEHAVWYPECEFVRAEKGQNFIDEARRLKFQQSVVETPDQSISKLSIPLKNSRSWVFSKKM